MSDAPAYNRVFTVYYVFLDDKAVKGSLSRALQINSESDKNHVTSLYLRPWKDLSWPHTSATKSRRDNWSCSLNNHGRGDGSPSVAYQDDDRISLSQDHKEVCLNVTSLWTISLFRCLTLHRGMPENLSPHGVFHRHTLCADEKIMWSTKQGCTP